MAYIFPGCLVPALDNTGDPLSGAKMYVYLAETTTLTPSYTSDEAAVENTNPVVTDSSGKWPPVYLNAEIPARVKATNAAGDYTLYDIDYISPAIPGTVALYSVLAANGGAALIGTAGGITVEAALAASGKAFGRGLFSSFAGAPPSVATGQNIVRTTGYSTTGIGSALYIYDAAVNGAYVTAHPRAAFLAEDGRGFRLDPGQPITIEMFGAIADSTGTSGTDTLAPFNAAMAYEDFNPLGIIGGSGIGVWVDGCNIEFGKGRYWFSELPELHKIVHIKGQSTGHNHSGSPNGTVWDYPADGKAFRIHNTNTVLATSDANGAGAAQGSIIEGITFVCAGGTDVTKPCLHIRGVCTVMNCAFFAIPGDAIYLNATATSGGATEGNANNCHLLFNFVHSCGGNALTLIGADVNTCIIIGFQTGAAVGGCSILDRSGLGCHFFGLHLMGYGNKGVTHGGRHYQLIDPTAGIGASTTPGTNNAIWYDLGAGAVSVQFPAWSGAATYRPMIPILVFGDSTRSVYSGVYVEGAAVLSHIPPPAEMNGGQLVCTTRSSHTTADLSSFGLISPRVSALGFGGKQGFYSGSAEYTLYGASWNATIGRQPGYSWAFRSELDGAEYAQRLVSGDVIVDRGANTADSPYLWTTPSTARTFGRSAAVPYVFRAANLAIASDNGNDRIVFSSNVAPTTGYHAKGEIVFNNNVSAGGTMGWMCTTAGTPGTWKAMPNVAA